MKRRVRTLFASADEAAVRPILEALRAKGFDIAEETDRPQRGEAMLLFLSEGFAASGELQERFFAAGDAAVIPVDLDGAAQSELVREALIARNAIRAGGRSAAEIAERVASAEVFEDRGGSKKLRRVLLAAALLLALGAGLWLWRGASGRAEARERAAILSAAKAKYGLSEEDLAEIRNVYIVSDGFYPLREEEGEKAYTIFPNYSMEADGMHWTSHEDGHRIYAADWAPGDWDVLKLMSNLEGLVIVLADAGSLPDLSGLEHLEWMQAIDSRITDIGGLRGSSLTYFGNFRCPIEDYSPLTSCERLESVVMEFDFLEEADLSGFSPPALEYARFSYGPLSLKLDLSGLQKCTTLEELILSDIPCGPPDGGGSTITDLDFLAGLPKLKTLTIERMSLLEDVSALGTLPSLEELTIDDCERLTDISALSSASALRRFSLRECGAVRDFSPLGSCRALQEVNIDSDNLRDTSFLSGLPALQTARLNNKRNDASLRDVDFLRTLAPGTEPEITLNAGVNDYSGLAGPESYAYLSLGPHEEVLDRALPYQRDKHIGSLTVMQVKPSDWALMPERIDSLWVINTELTDLEGLSAWRLEEIRISGNRKLRSLDGIEALQGLDAGTLSVEINECPTLSDLSALKGAFLSEICIRDTLNVPELPELRVKRLRLENVPELTDLRCLDTLDASGDIDFTLVGLDALRDLSPLRRFHGESLIVPPHLAEQAAELVESGNFQSYEIAYPEEGWVFSNDTEITLLSLDELDTLSKTLLRNVAELYAAGDAVVDTARFEPEENWDDGELRLILRDRAGGEDSELVPGPGRIKDLSILSELTGLRRLTLCCQPMEDLEGIQTLDALEELAVKNCARLADASAAFTLQGLRRLELSGCPLRAIEGVQNLAELEELDLTGTGVEDLTPLTELGALRRVTISADMVSARDSLAGSGYAFELIVE